MNFILLIKVTQKTYEFYSIKSLIKVILSQLIKMLNGNGCLFVCLMVFNATFNTISVISWRSVLLVEETGGPGENHRHVASH